MFYNFLNFFSICEYFIIKVKGERRNKSNIEIFTYELYMGVC